MTDLILDVEQIKKLLPHRAPMLLVEKLADIVPPQSATGYKSVSINEPWFAGHFPERAVMPGVLIVEAMAQTAGALVMLQPWAAPPASVVYFMAIEKARFRKPCRPATCCACRSSWCGRAGRCGNSKARPLSATRCAPKPSSAP